MFTLNLTIEFANFEELEIVKNRIQEMIRENVKSEIEVDFEESTFDVQM